MFYVNDIDGLKFKGPMEKLEEWRLVSRKVSSKPVQEGEVSFTMPKGPGGNAVAAYQKIISQEHLVEPLVHVYQIMSTPPQTIYPDISLAEAWLSLRNLEIRQLIVSEDRQKIVGMLSDKDLLKRLNVVENEVQVDQGLSVMDVINKEFVSTESISDIRRVARVLANFHIDAMPVLEEERLVGVVTRGDILRGFALNPKLNLWA